MGMPSGGLAEASPPSAGGVWRKSAEVFDGFIRPARSG